jgi:alpha-amylase/alpha-mannosidase (GH57 family)
MMSPDENAAGESDNPLRVVLCWHMHQPQYRNLSTRQYALPWTYLHAMKDYVDMAFYLENCPQAKAVFNFSPILLEQLRDYSKQIQLFFSHNQAIGDPLLAALVSASLPNDEDHYLALVKQCLKANEKHIIARFPPYQKLAELAVFLKKNNSTLLYTNHQFLSDLLTWYHLAWMAETTRKNDERIIQLIEKGSGFSMHERLLLLRIISEQIDSIIPRYKKLVASGQVELSMSPYAHPILPLLLDFNHARQSVPESALPNEPSYPGGEQRCQWHIHQGLALFEDYFGERPTGCWPSEGAISEDTVSLLDAAGFKWIASGQQVLMNSINKSAIAKPECIHHPYSIQHRAINCFFRDDRLSDLIGFTYQDWHGDDAVNNLIHELERIAKTYSTTQDKVVSIILDGENCWEYYYKNGYHFLTALYEKLSHHPIIRMTTFSECIDANMQTLPLSDLVAGSWVYGTLSTWVGDADKNKAWDALVKAKKVYDALIQSDTLDDEQKANAQAQLAICEGSDWFWWFGDYNPAESVSDFESLYRNHLANLYRFLGQEIPEELTISLSHGSDNPKSAGVMRRSQES